MKSENKNKSKTKSMRKKSVAVLAGIAIAGAVGASAASLGGLGGDDLGADAADVASCDTNGIDVSYTTAYDADLREYTLESIDLADINANCQGQTFDLTVLLKDFDGVGQPESVQSYVGTIALSETVPGTVDGDTQSIDTTNNGETPPVALDIPAEDVVGLAMSISGNTVATA